MSMWLELASLSMSSMFASLGKSWRGSSSTHTRFVSYSISNCFGALSVLLQWQYCSSGCLVAISSTSIKRALYRTTVLSHPGRWIYGMDIYMHDYDAQHSASLDPFASTPARRHNVVFYSDLWPWSSLLLPPAARGNGLPLAMVLVALQRRRRHGVHAEMYMMVQKARLFDDAETAAQMVATTEPRKHKGLGRAVKGFDARVWDERECAP
jgi:hypothetical protein